MQANSLLMQADSLQQVNNCPWPEQSITQASAIARTSLSD